MILIPEGDADGNAEMGISGQLLQQVNIPLDQRSLGDDPYWISVIQTHLEAAPGQFEGGLQWLVAIGDPAENDELPFPRGPIERLAQEGGSIGLCGNFRVEVRASSEAQVLVSRARVAISAGVHAAAVGIDAEAKADVRAVVSRQNFSGLVLVNLQPARRRLSKVVHFG
jgi:hypothetical protein